MERLRLNFYLCHPPMPNISPGCHSSLHSPRSFWTTALTLHEAHVWFFWRGQSLHPHMIWAKHSFQRSQPSLAKDTTKFSWKTWLTNSKLVLVAGCCLMKSQCFMWRTFASWNRFHPLVGENLIQTWSSANCPKLATWPSHTLLKDKHCIQLSPSHHSYFRPSLWCP